MKETFTAEEEINEVHGGTHVVLLGAGASIASTARNQEMNGKKLPAMNNIVDVPNSSKVSKQKKEFALS